MKQVKAVAKRLSAAFLALLLAASFCTPIGGTGTALLGDGSFDTPMTPMTDGNTLSDGIWTSMSWASAVSEPENARTGSGVANLVFNAPGLAAGEYPTIYQDVAVEANSIYRLTFYAKQWTPEGSPTQPLYYGYRNSLADVWTPIEQYSVSDLDNNYREITLELNTKALSHIRVFAFTTSIQTGGYGGYHLDDFSLEYVKPAVSEPPVDPDNLIKDASFANAMTNMTDGDLPSVGFWTSMSWASSVAESANAHAGAGLANLVYNAPGLPAGEYPTIYQDIAVEPNSIYKLRFYAKCWTAEGDPVQPLYYGYRNALTDVWTPIEQYSVSGLDNNYREITLEFDTKTLTQIRIFAFTTSIQTGGYGGYHLDDFSVKYVKPAAEGPTADNLIKDPSFTAAMTPMTDGTISSEGVWTSMSWASTINEEANAHSGSSLANLVYNAPDLPAGEYPTIYQDVAVEPYSIYLVSFYAKCWTASGDPIQPLYYGYRNALADVWTPIEQLSVSDLDSEYRQIRFEINTKSLTSVRIFAFTESIHTGGFGGYHLDDFSMKYVGKANQKAELAVDGNLVQDGSFNNKITIMTDGNLPSVGFWTSMSWVSAVEEDENALYGTHLANLVYNAPELPAGEFPTIYQDVKVQPSTLYRVTFYAKQWTAPGDPTQPLYYGYRNGNRDVWIPAEQYKLTDVGSEYQKISFVINSKDLSTVRVFVFTESIHTGAIGGYHIDGFSMVRLGYYTNYKDIPIAPDLDEDNLLYDTSFENGDSRAVSAEHPEEFADVWTMMSWAGIDRVYDFAYTGKSNLFMVYSADGLPRGDYPTVWQDVMVEENTWYEMSFFIKQWGVAAENAQLYYGYRDPKAGNIWINTVEFIGKDFPEQYQQVTCRFNSGNRNILRLFFCIVALDFQEVGGAGGYHIDNVQLHRCSNVTGVEFATEGDILAGHCIDYSVWADFENGNTHVPVLPGNEKEISFISSDETVVTADLQGNLVACGAGSASVQAVVRCNGVSAVSEPQTITVTTSGKTYISGIEVSVEGTAESGCYTPVLFEIRLSDGTTLPAGTCDISMQVSDENVLWAKPYNNGYAVYGVGQGEAELYVTAQAEADIGVGHVAVRIDDGNLLLDSSFEQQDLPCAHWNVKGTAAYGVDNGSTNVLSRTGEANLWTAAPVTWTEDVLPGSSISVSQDLQLSAGDYTLSAFINRFYATGTSGMLAELGGTVSLEVAELDANGREIGQPQQHSFDVTYGVGKYQKLEHSVQLKNDGAYRVSVNIQGSESFGLGMQLEDVFLVPTSYPEAITAQVAPAQEGSAVKVLVTATYPDGSTQELTENLTCTVADEAIASPAGRYLLCKTAGRTDVTVTAIVNGKSYSAECAVEVAPTNNSTEIKEESKLALWLSLGGGAALLAAGGAVILLKKRSKHKKQNEQL